LSDTDQLRSAVNEANRFMRKHYPTSIQDAFEAHRQQLQIKDPRFDVDVAAIGGRIGMIARSKEPVRLSLIYKGEPSGAGKRIFDLAALGCPVKFNAGEIAIQGTELMKWVEEQGTVLQVARPIPGEARTIVSYLNKEGAEVARLEIPGQIRETLAGSAFEGRLAGSLFSLTFGPIRKGKVVIRHPMDCREWNGQPLLQLPYFESVVSVCEAIPDTASRVFRCEHLGNAVCTISQTPQLDNEHLPMLRHLLGVLRKARAIAAKLGVNPLFTFDKMSAECCQSIEMLHDLLFDGVHMNLERLSSTST
jgi:hypothetical protein